MDITSMLSRVDEMLASISVKGDDAFVMVRARQTLKTAWDISKREAKNENTDSSPDV